MIDLNTIQRVYFIGIGGIGMSALARYFNAQGKAVAGYDRKATKLTDELALEGMSVHFQDSLAAIPSEFKAAKDTLVVYTPAVPAEHEELNWLTNEGFPVHKRSEVLGMLTAQTFTIAIAGTHGKTTTSSMVAHILRHTGYKSNAFLGGIATNYNSNLLLSNGAETTVVEADEYDRSFLALYPNLAVLTSVDADHLDIYGNKSEVEESFRLFAEQIKPGGKLICKQGLPVFNLPGRELITYSAGVKADIYAKNIHVEAGRFVFDLNSPKGYIDAISLALPGFHNVENCVAAIAIAQELGIDNKAIKTAVEAYLGVKRRFEFQVNTENLVYIDDYAHHPEEIKACISSVRELYPGRKITGIFQPHLYSRTRDFADEFAESLGMLNELILMEIYPAREMPIPGVDSTMLLSKVMLDEKIVVDRMELVETLRNRQLEVVVTMGAGDIDKLVEPIRKALEKRTQEQN